MTAKTPLGLGPTLAILVAGTAIGVAIGWLGRPADKGSDAEAIAVVDGVPIPRTHYERALAALQADRREPLSDEDRRHVLDRLIDEELLIAHALDMGLARRDRRVRAELVSAVVQAQLALAADESVGEDELRAFFERNKDWFTPVAKMRVWSMWWSAPDEATHAAALAEARRIREQVRNADDFARLRKAHADKEVAPLPDGLLPPHKIQQYIGPTATDTALAMRAGQVSEPIVTADGVRLVFVVERVDADPPAFENVVDEVVQERERRGGEEELRELLSRLREHATVTIDDGAGQ
ncbi:peptidyl-prolyl cis-trans isomerase [bacterium]|nr:peptidyl-prolyl cis-trans isomerase [bacterium]